MGLIPSKSKSHLFIFEKSHKIVYPITKGNISQTGLIQTKRSKIKKVLEEIKTKPKGYFQTTIKYIDQEGNEQFYSKTLYAHEEPSEQHIADFMDWTVEGLEEGEEAGEAITYGFDEDEPVEISLSYTYKK